MSQNASGWQSVHLSLPTAVNLIYIDAVAGVEPGTATVSYIAIDDVSISDSVCANRGNFETLVRMLVAQR